MIIWLASYPRSGNRLTRTLLYKTMGLRSTTDELDHHPRSKGHEMDLVVSEKWDDFYRYATQSSEIFLVKTHRPPRDEQPAIYIARDGRKSCLSYRYFHQRLSSPPFPSLLEIVMGQDFYGSWTDHYRMWEKRENVFMARFEDLANASDELLTKLADWVRYSGEIKPWVNPFEEERKLNPHLLREGRAEWQGEDPAWTPLIDSIFFNQHGDLMVELGYATPADVDNARRAISGDIQHLVDISNRLSREKNEAMSLVIELQKSICRLTEEKKIHLRKSLFRWVAGK